jgi:hypothetical protein
MSGRVDHGPEPDIEAAWALLRDWLSRRLEPAGLAWLTTEAARLAAERGDTALAIAFGLVPRRLGRQMLALSAEESAAAGRCIEGWMPGDWSLADAGRILLLAGLPGRDPAFAPRFRALCQTADVAEAIALYRGLPLYPEPATLEPQVGEGLRSNMRSVFEAIAHRNPYPRRHFDTHRWNHMVLKALFIGSRLAPIQGLDERANEELARIMRDFAHERWAAGRPVPFEIWRCVGPFASGEALADLERVLDTGEAVEQRAAALALAASPDPAAAALLGRLPDLAAEIASGRLGWAVLQ